MRNDQTFFNQARREKVLDKLLESIQIETDKSYSLMLPREASSKSQKFDMKHNYKGVNCSHVAREMGLVLLATINTSKEFAITNEYRYL